jgi:hypothetical protein
VGGPAGRGSRDGDDVSLQDGLRAAGEARRHLRRGRARGAGLQVAGVGAAAGREQLGPVACGHAQHQGRRHVRPLPLSRSTLFNRLLASAVVRGSRSLPPTGCENVSSAITPTTLKEPILASPMGLLGRFHPSALSGLCASLRRRASAEPSCELRHRLVPLAPLDRSFASRYGPLLTSVV